MLLQVQCLLSAQGLDTVGSERQWVGVFGGVVRDENPFGSIHLQPISVSCLTGEYILNTKGLIFKV